MANLLPSGSVTISTLMDNLNQVKYNPSAIQRVIFDYLDEVTGSQVNVVDPTNPFVFLLESSSVNTALAVIENMATLRGLYPSLATTAADLYHHMSDQDYLSRFATPSETTFTVAVLVNDIRSKLEYDSTLKGYKGTIARDTQFRADQTTFTIEYPIDIVLYDSGNLKISYDAEIDSPLSTLSTNIIQYTTRTESTGQQWVFFEVPAKQFAVASSQYPLQRSAVFKTDIPFTDQYYYCRVYQSNPNTGNNWKELKTTHSDQVYDSLTPTASLRVTDNVLTVQIPSIYQNNGTLSGTVRVDVFTTKGQLSINLGNYKMTSFTLRMQALDEKRDINKYTVAMGKVTSYAFSNKVINGGSNSVTLEALRTNVINNTVGSQQLPVTNKQVDARLSAQGFNLVTNVDVLTNRIFLAVRKLPKPLNQKLLTAANIGIGTLVSTPERLVSKVNSPSTGYRTTLMSGNIFINDQGYLTLVDTAGVNRLNALSRSALVTELNSKSYLFNPFYYVLDDSNNEFSVRAYNLDYPKASTLSFDAQNETLQLPVNTSTYRLTKTSSGYSLYITTLSGQFYKDMNVSEIGLQLAYTPAGESTLAYINATLESTSEDGEHTWKIDFVTTYDLDSDDDLYITNSKMYDDTPIGNWVSLTQKFHLLHYTTSITDGYVKSVSDDLLGKFILPASAVCMTHETIQLKFGNPLKNLWVRSRSMASGADYQTYSQDMPLLYDEDVYQVDPATGSYVTFNAQGQPVTTILHRRGDAVLNAQGQPVYRYRKGDVVLDLNGKPVKANNLTITKEVDLLLVDGRQFFADDQAYVTYNTEMISVLETWINQDLQDVQTDLLEQTRIYYRPDRTLGKTAVLVRDNTLDHLESEQALTVELYVSPSVYTDSVIRQKLISQTVGVLDKYISGTSINMTEITSAMKSVFGDTVSSLQIFGLGGEKNYQILSLVNEENRLCLKKTLVLQPDNTMIVTEDVTVNFYRTA